MTSENQVIAYVSTQLQAVNVVELCLELGIPTESVDLVLSTYSNAAHREQISILLQHVRFRSYVDLAALGATMHDFHWHLDQVARIAGLAAPYAARYAAEKLFTRWRMFPLVRETAGKPWIVSGNMHDVVPLLLARSLDARIAWVDDGVGSPRAASRYFGQECSNESVARNSHFFSRLSVKRRLHRSVSCDLVFSSFALPTPPNARFVRNEYKWLRSVAESAGIDSDVAAFIGQPFVRIGSISTDDYIDTLRAARRQFPELDWQYLPHPREQWAETCYFAHASGLVPVRPKCAVELLPLTNRRMPGLVASINSTALITLKSLYRTRVRTVAVRPRSWANRHEDVFRQISEAGIQYFDAL